MNIANSEIQTLKSQLAAASVATAAPKGCNSTASAAPGGCPSKQFDERWGELISVENALDTYLPEKVKNEVNRIIYGNGSSKISVDQRSLDIAAKHDFEIQAYKISAGKEQARPPRIVRVGAVQNIYKSETTAPILQQRDAIHEYNKKILEAAHLSGVNVICFQELWTCPFFVSTREKYPWIELAESANNGPTTEMLCEYAKKYKMVIINSILERDD